MRTVEAEALDGMWAAQRESVRRVLLALTGDIDLADDLLQDTYLRARQGISSYRGGDARAWLSAIARNVYASHARRRQTWAEVSAGETQASQEPLVDPVELLAIRQALIGFPTALRTALIMKHYAGYTYQEIARHEGCAVGTAKWRVSEALDRLRLVLQERKPAMTSAEEHGIALVDYVYGVLPQAEAAKARTHLAKCESCRGEAEELQRVVSALDALEGDHKQMHFVELDAEGRVTLHVTGSHVNTSEGTLPTFSFNAGRGTVQHFYQDGEEASFTAEPHPRWDYLDTYTVSLPHPVPPGARMNGILICAPAGAGRAESLGEGRFRLHWQQTPGYPVAAYVQAIRLPAGARLLSADPQPAETRANGAATLVWRTVLADEEAFECTVEYELR